jgi:hypothetical protein
MQKLYTNEIFKEIELEKGLQLRYAISNYGRFVSFTDKIEEGQIVNGSKQDGYRIWRYRVRDKKNKFRYRHKFLYRLVAECFITRTSKEQIFVLHLDRDRANDHVDNLKWATKAEMVEHSKNSPFVINAREKQIAERKEKHKQKGNKLTSTQVMLLKRILLNPYRKTRLKIIARQFGVSQMQLYRIKTGENWGHIENRA